MVTVNNATAKVMAKVTWLEIVIAYDQEIVNNVATDLQNSLRYKAPFHLFRIILALFSIHNS